MHFCTCFIAIAGDPQQIAPRNTFDPVSWPEIEVLRQLHGDDAVSNVRVFVQVDQDPRAERERLKLIYGEPVVEQCFPGRNPRMEMEAANVELPQETPDWRNPLTMDFSFREPPTLDPKPERSRKREPLNI